MKRNEVAFSSSSWAPSEYLTNDPLVILVLHIYIVLIDLCLV